MATAALQVGFCAESKELGTWLKHCHERRKRERCLPTRHDAAWLHEFDRIEQVRLAGSSLFGPNSQLEPCSVLPNQMLGHAVTAGIDLC